MFVEHTQAAGRRTVARVLMPQLALDRKVTIVSLHKRLHKGEPQPCSIMGTGERSVDLIERLGQTRNILLWYPGAVIGNFDQRNTSLGKPGSQAHSTGPLLDKLERI